MRRQPLSLPTRSEVPIDWFLARVTAKTGTGASAQYQFVEVSLDGAGAYTPDGRGRTGTAINYGVSAGAELAVGDVALCRSADGAAGLKWELAPLGSGSAGGGDAHFLAPVYCAATGPGTLASDFEAGDTLDGVTLTAGMSILIVGQSTTAENGVYTVNASGAPTRRADADTSAEVHGAVVAVLYGDTLARSVWVCTAPLQPTSFSTQVWERVGNTAYQTAAGTALVGWAAPGSGYDTPVPCRIGPPTPAGQLGASLDDGPGFAANAVFSTSFRSLSFGLSSTAGTVAGGYPTGVPVAFVTVTRNDTGLPTGTPVAVGLAAGLQLGAAVASGPSVDNPLVLRAFGDGTKYSFIELGGNTKPASTDYRTYLRISGAAVLVSRAGGTATFDADGGYLVGGVAGLTGTLGPGAAATGGIITALGSGSFVGTASSNAFTNTNSFSATVTFTGALLSQSGATLTPASAAAVPATIQGAAAQTANLTEWKNSGGTVLASVSASGALSAASFTGSASGLTSIPSGQLTGALPAISGASLTVLSSSALTGALPAISGAALTSLTAANLSGAVAVANGGTGQTSLTAYAVLCGGTTGTGAVQSVAGLGSAGDVLTSNGAGALPTFQAPAAAGVPQGHIDGLALSYNSASTVNVAAGQCAESTGAYLLALSAGTKVIQSSGSWAAGSGNNGLDTGAIANNTWYHVFVIAKADGTSPDVLFSTSATAPTMPATYTLKRRIGAIKTGVAGIALNWLQRGDTFLWTSPQDDVSALNPGTSAVTRTLSTPPGARTLALVTVGFDAAATGDNPASIYLSDLDAANDAPSVAIVTFINYSASAHIANTLGQAQVWTSTSSQIRSRLQASATNTRLRIQTLGWIDPRGRDGL